MSPGSPEGGSRPLVGVAWAVLAVFSASFILALPKASAGGLSPLQITLIRYITGFATVAPLFLATRLRPAAPDAITPERGTFRLHILRAVLAVTRLTCIFYAVTHMPFANAQAITLTNSVFMIIFAVILLGERVRPATMLAAAVCFVGAVIAAEPALDLRGFLSPGALAALLGAALWGVEAMVIKYTAYRDGTLRILFIVNAAALCLIAIPGIAAWQPLTLTQWALLALIGPLAIFTQAANIQAFRAADANILAPFRYVSVIFGLAIGWFAFGEWPSPLGLLGMTLIFAGGFALTISMSRSQRNIR